MKPAGRVMAMLSVADMARSPPTDLPWDERSAYVEDPDGNLDMLAAPGTAAA